MKKWIASATLIGMLVGSFGTYGMTANKQTFKDVGVNHTAYEAIEYVSKEGIMSGYSDGKFKPNKAVTRAELAMVINRLDEEKEDYPTSIPKPEPQPEQSEQPKEVTNPITKVESFKYYLDAGSNDIAKKMGQQDLVVVEPVVMEQKYIKEAQTNGTLVYGYINSMEADKWNTDLMKQFKEEAFYHDKNGKRHYISQWDAYLMDISNKHYQDVLLNEIQKQVVDKGLNGVFFDTVGSIEDYHYKDAKVLKQQQEGMKAFMQRVKERFPNLSIGQNWGFDTLEGYTAPYVDFIMWEDFSAPNIKNDDWYAEKIEQLKRVRANHGVEVLAISFKDQTGSKKIAEQHGFKISHNSVGSYYNQ